MAANDLNEPAQPVQPRQFPLASSKPSYSDCAPQREIEANPLLFAVTYKKKF
jgi:hypothetical protein